MEADLHQTQDIDQDRTKKKKKKRSFNAESKKNYSLIRAKQGARSGTEIQEILELRRGRQSVSRVSFRHAKAQDWHATVSHIFYAVDRAADSLRRISHATHED